MSTEWMTFFDMFEATQLCLRSSRANNSSTSRRVSVT